MTAVRGTHGRRRNTPRRGAPSNVSTAQFAAASQQIAKLTTALMSSHAARSRAEAEVLRSRAEAEVLRLQQKGAATQDLAPAATATPGVEVLAMHVQIAHLQKALARKAVEADTANSRDHAPTQSGTSTRFMNDEMTDRSSTSI